MAEHCPLKRCAVPEDVARVVAFLASDDGGWVNGKPQAKLSTLLFSLTNRRSSHHDLRRLVPVNENCPRHAKEQGVDPVWRLPPSED